MENKALMSRAIQYQKAASDNIFSLVATLQNSGEKIVKETLDQYSWLPESSKKGLIDWYDTCTKTTDGLKEMVDRSYEEMEKYLITPEPEQQAAKTTSQTVVKTEATPRTRAPKKPAATKAKPTPVKKTATKTAPAKVTAAKKSTAKSPSTTAKTAPAATTRGTAKTSGKQTKSPAAKSATKTATAAKADGVSPKTAPAKSPEPASGK